RGAPMSPNTHASADRHERRAVVLGGGYAGVMAANRLTRKHDLTVTMINPRSSFVERIRLHQHAAGTYAAARGLREVLSDPVDLITDTVTRIDTPARRLELASSGSIDYDYLVYAAGSGNRPGGTADVPGGDLTYRIGVLEEAQRLQAALHETPASAPVTVVGGGLTGIETAAELAGGGRRVSLLCGGVLAPSLHPRARQRLRHGLARLGVEVREGSGSRAVAVEVGHIELDDGRRLLSEVTVWAAGFAAADLAARSGLRTDAAGRLRTDETLTSIDDLRIVAAGDAAAPSGLPVRMSCQAAMQLGPQAAETVLPRIAGRQPPPIGVAFVSQCVSLGRKAGLMQLTRRDDSPIRLHMGGRAGAVVKETICSGILTQLRFEARHPGRMKWWQTDPRRQRRLASATSQS